MLVSRLLRVWFLCVVLGLAIASGLPASARAERPPDAPLFGSAPVALSPLCGFIAPCGGFDAIGLHIANSTLLHGNGDRSFAAVQDLLRLSVTLLDVVEVGGALGGHFAHDQAGDSHTATAPARLFARLRLYPWPWASLAAGLSISAAVERSFVSQRLGADEPPGFDLSTARLVAHNSLQLVELDAAAGVTWGAVPDGRWVNLELSAAIALNLFVDPNDPNEKLRVLVQAVYRQPLARPDGAPSLREVYATAGVRLDTSSGYFFGIGVGPELLGSRPGALVLFEFGVSWGLRYRNPLAESLAGKRRIPAFWMDLFYTDPVLRADGCVWSDPLPQAEPFLIKCLGRPDPKDPGTIVLFSGGRVAVGTHLWVRDDGTLIDSDQFEIGDIDKELVPYVRAIQALAAKLAKEKRDQEAATGQRCAYQADILRGVTDPGLLAVLAHDDMGGAAALLGTELFRALKCGDPKALGGGGILPLLGRLPLKKGPISYRGSLLGPGEAEHLEPAALPPHKPLGDKARSHIFYGTVDKDKRTGWHYEPTADRSKGTYVMNSSPLDKHGVYKAKVMIENVEKGPYSTFFPKHWSEEQVEKAILEAYENRQLERVNPERYQATLSSGVRIEMQLDKDGSIITAYPIWEGKP